MFYSGIYLPSVGYCLPVSHFAQEELEAIQKSSHRAMLAHKGFNRNTARAVQFGPQPMGAIEMYHLYDTQGFGQVTLVLKSWRSPHTIQSRVLKIALQWAQYTSGIGVPILEAPHIKLPHLESKWLQSLRVYLVKVQGKLRVANPGIPTLQRVHDQYLMDMVLANPKWKPSQIKRINWCRLYLNVTTLSDITTAQGNEIDPAIYNGTLESVQAQCTWQCVNQKKPNNATWKVWRQFCRSFTQSRSNRRYQLKQPLGNWIVPAAQMRRQWPYWHDPIHNRLLKKTSHTYTIHLLLRHDFDADPAGQCSTLPAAAIPVDVTVYAHTFRVHHHYIQWQLPPSVASPQDIQSLIPTLPAWEQQLLQGLTLQVPMSELLSHLQSPILVASDGSVKDHRSSFGWVLANHDGLRLLSGRGPAPAAKPTSYRAEGIGILSVLRCFYHLKQLHSISVSGTLLCDNKSMIEKTQAHADFKNPNPNSTMESDWDVIAEIWNTIQAGSLSDHLSFVHIKGHADKEKKYDELTLRQQLNVDADHLAGGYIERHWDEDYSIAPIYPTSGCQIDLPHGTTTYKLKRELRWARTEPLYRAYLCKKYKWNDTTFSDVDWECLRRALNRKRNDRTLLTKYLNDITPVGHMVHRYDPKYSPQCPSCSQPDETQEHLVHCPAAPRKQWRATFLDTLRKTLTTLDTPDDMMELLLGILKCYINQDDPSTVHIPATVSHIAEQQQAIGWHQLLQGRFTEAWRLHYHQYLGSKATNTKNGHTWVTSVITTIFTQWLDLWKLRNQDRHGKDSQAQDDVARRQAVTELQTLYNLQDLVLPHHAWLFHTPLHQLQNKRTSYLRHFIANFGPLIHHSCKTNSLESYQTRLETG